VCVCVCVCACVLVTTDDSHDIRENVSKLYIADIDNSN
jgi:hypothetical protein